jgi:hypothetical protein
MSADVAAGPPPAIAASFFLGPDARFRLTDWCSLASITLSITGQLLRPDGCVVPFVETHTPNSDRTAASKIFASGSGWLLDAQITVTSGTVRRGQCFVRLEIVQGSTGAVQALATILQGYVASNVARAYPGSPIEDSLTGPGAVRSITGTDPAANTESSETVPTGARWQLRLWSATLVTDANVANRVAILTVDDGTTVLGRFAPASLQAASLSYSYTFCDIGVGASLFSGAVTQAAPMPIQLPAGSRIRTVTASMQATDNWGAPQLLVEEWLEP